MARRAEATSNLSQLAQIVTNIEHFEVACSELERSLTNIRSVLITLHQNSFANGTKKTRRSSQRGGTIRVNASKSFATTLQRALARVNASITSKLDDFFGLSEYEWTPAQPDSVPSMYLEELAAWLSTVVDSLQIREEYKAAAYAEAIAYIARCLMVRPPVLCAVDVARALTCVCAGRTF